MDILFEITIRPVDQFFTTKYTIPNEIPGTTPTFLWVFFAFVVEIQTDLGVDTNTKVIVHNAFLFEVIPVFFFQ